MDGRECLSEVVGSSQVVGSSLRPGRIFIDLDSLLEGKRVSVRLSGAEIELDLVKVKGYLEKVLEEIS